MKLNEVIAKYGNQEVDELKIKDVLGVKDSAVWKPNHNEHYYFFDYGGAFRDRFISNADEKRYELGNCFKSYKEAEFARDKQIFLTKFERYLRENEDEPVDWSAKNTKYFIGYNYLKNEIGIDFWDHYENQGSIVTTNIYALEKFIKDNESNIKKYMFGVE